MKYIKETFWDEEFYLNKVSDLEKTTTNLFLKQFLRVDRARHHYNKTHKNGEINLYTNALKLVDTILNTKVNVNALAEAEKIKIEINNKHLEINLPKISYPKQNNKAFVNFKNIDSLTISYYELPQKLN